MSFRTNRRRAAQSVSRAIVESLEHRMLFARFAVIGDMVESSSLAQIASMVKAWSPAHIVTVGDNDNLNNTRYEDTVGQYFHDWMSPYLGDWGQGSSSGNRFWPAMGNHDWDSSTGSAKYTAYFTLPGKERYYSKVLDNVEFFMFDSDTREPDGTSASSTQGTWLRNALAASTAKWKIVIAHHPPYTSGTEPDGTWIRHPFKSWGADVVLSGHQHNYERLSVDGIPYIVNGPAGATTGGGWGSIDSRSLVRYNTEDGAMRIDSSDTSLNLRFYNRFGTEIDSVTLDSTSPPPPPPPPPDTTSFVASGDAWKYLDNGSNQGTAWRGTSFSDSTWKTGTAQLGYGDGDEATIVSYGSNASNKYVTTYFRRSFSVSDASAFSGLNLKLLRDDGAVVYLNGVEVHRSNMPSGTIAYNTFASSTVDSGESTWYSTTFGTSSLVSGTNVISVEVHQSVASSSDLSFDLSLSGVPKSTSSPGTAYLSDLTWASATNGYGPVELDMGNGGSGAGDGAAIRLNGVTYAKGLGAHASSNIVYNLNGAYSSFISDIGVDDRQTTSGSIVFQVYLDGVKVYDSGIMRPATATKSMNLSVAGKNQLRLVITDAGDGNGYDHGDWAGARLTAAAARTALVTSSSSLLTSNIERDPLELLL